MDNYSDMLMEDLIECDVEETDGNSYTAWTEQALDLFISQLKMVKKHTFSSEREMLQVVTNKMSHRNFAFTLDQIENKYNSLKKMYTDKKQNNLTVEPELAKLFGDTPATSSKRQNNEEINTSVKKTKVASTDDNSPKPNQSGEDASVDDPEANKAIWSKNSVVTFLGFLEEYRPQLGFEIRTKKLMWETISKRLKQNGFDLSPSQVENKWKSLLRHYRGRQEMLRARTSISKGIPNKRAFPELFEEPIVSTGKHLEISFANDQKLPFDDADDDDDDVSDEEDAFQFEEVCSIPEVNIVSDVLDPVYVEDVKPSVNELHSRKPSQASRPSRPSKLYKKVLQNQTDSLNLKRMRLEAYKERTLQFSRIGDALIALAKQKDANI